MNKWIKLLIGIGVSAVGLHYSFNNVDLNEILFYLSSSNFTLILLGMVLLVLSVFMRAIRWKMMIDSIESIEINKLFSATMIGYFGNSVFPFRMGELLRAFALSKNAKIETSTAFGSILLERIIDMLGLVFLIIIFGSLYPFSDYSKNIMFYVVVFTLFILGIIIFLSFKKTSLIKFVENFSGYRKIIQFIKSILEGLTLIRDIIKSGKIIIFTILIWGIYFLITWLVSLSLGVGLDWIGIGVTLIFTSLAISLPAAPSAVGTYHAAAIYVLTELFLLDRSIAQSFAVILHAVGFFPLISIGALYFIKSSIELGDISMGKK